MQSNAIFWNKIARRYAASPVADVPAYEHTLARTRTYLKSDDNVLEMGCGTGTTALKLSDAAAHITATDIAENMLQIAREKGEAQGVQNVTFEVADDTLGQFEKESFDVALAFSLLHLLHDAPAGLARAYDVLKPGGYFISKTVCLKSRIPVLPVVVRVMQLFGKAPHVAFYRPDDLRDMISAAGFEIVERANHNKGTRGHFIVARKPV